MDKYDLGPVVGKGSFGVVVLATRRDDGHQFVMKRLPIHSVTDKEMEAYQNEIRLLSELEHPGVVGYIESFVDRASMDLCIVMAYCSGGDLTAFLKSTQKLAEAEIKHFFVQMALALHFMHEKNILHRDLKSGNVFLRKSGGIVQLGDFGISKVLNGASDLAQTCIGTPYYMSPELFKNKSYNHKSDVWALGCILYELTSLKHAFDAQNINGLANKVIHGVYPPIATSYSKDLRELIKSMLGVTPSSRPSVKQILLMPSLLKSVRRYIRHVVSAAGEHEYRPAHVLNLKNQLERIGPPLAGLFAEVERERVEKKAAAGSSDAHAHGHGHAKVKVAGRRSQVVAGAADEEDDLNTIERTMIAGGGGGGGSGLARQISDETPATIRRRPGAPPGERGYNMAARLADLDREHAARVEELRMEEEAKKKLEKDFERLQAMQAQRAQRLKQRRAQLPHQSAADASASTATTSKDSSTASAGSSGGHPNLPIISSASSSSSSSSIPPPISVHSPQPPTSPPCFGGTLSLPVLPQPPTKDSRNSSPSLNPNRLRGAKPPTFSLHHGQRSASPASFLATPSPNNVGVAASISPTSSHASSPRLSGIPRRLNGAAASSAAAALAAANAAAEELSPISLSAPAPTHSPPPLGAPPLDGLRLLKRKVAVSRQAAAESAHASAASASPSPEVGPITARRGRARTHMPFPPGAPAPSGDIESTLLHEKVELERLRVERLRLEELLTRMDEEHGLFARGEASPSPRGSDARMPNSYGLGVGIAKVRSPIPPADEPSPRLGASLSPVATFSASGVLPAAFDAPLQYKGRDRSAAVAGAGGVPSAVGAAGASLVAQRALRRHSSQTDPPPVPRPRHGTLPAGAAAGFAGALQANAASTKDRILAAKAAKKSEEAVVEQARLMQARKEYHGDRVRAEQRTRDFYGNSVGAGGSGGGHSNSAPPPHSGFSSSPDSDSGTFLIYDDSHLAAHFNSDLLPTGAASAASLQEEEEELSASSLDVQQFQQHLAQYTRRIENLRSVIEVTSAAGGERPSHREQSRDRHRHRADDSSDSDESDAGYDTDSGDSAHASAPPPVPVSLAERKKQLALECVSACGRASFIAGYDYLREVQANPQAYEDDHDDARKIDRLTRLMGVDKVKHWRLIDQLLFVESC